MVFDSARFDLRPYVCFETDRFVRRTFCSWEDAGWRSLLVQRFAFAEVVLEQLAELLKQPLPQLLTDATRMLDVTRGDGAALMEIGAAQEMLTAQPELDLLGLTRLAVYRAELHERNILFPAELPGAWAALGQFARAEALA